MALIFLVVSLTTVMAAVAEVSPATNSAHTGTVIVNCSYTNGTEVTDPLAANTSFFTDASGAWIAESVTGFTVADNAVWATLDISSYDSSTVQFNCTLGNATDVSGSGAPQTGITFDSTAPVITIKQDYELGYGELVDHYCADTVDSSPTYTITHPTGDTPSSTTLTSGTSDYIQFLDTDYEGTFTFTCTDSTGNIATSDKDVGPLGFAQGSSTVDSTSDKMSNTTQALVWIGGIVLVGYILTKKK